MKRNLLRLLSVLLVLIFTFGGAQTAQAGLEFEHDELLEEEDYEQILQNVNEMEEYLKEQSTNVEQQLSNLIGDIGEVVQEREYVYDYRDSLEREMYLAQFDEFAEMVDGLITVYYEDKQLMSEFEQVQTRAYRKGGWIDKLRGRVRNAACRVAVANTIAICRLGGLKLTAELLVTARANDDENFVYIPVYGARRVKASSIYDSLKNVDDGMMDVGVFDSTKTTAELDLYLAIHRFSYEKEYGVLTIKDRYDFDSTGWKGIKNIAVKTMNQEINLGVIVPFDIEIRINL